MHSKHIRSLAPLAAGVLFAGILSGAPQQIAEADSKALGKLVQSYVENLDKTKEQEKARAGLQDALEKLGKRGGEKDKDKALQSVLARTADLGQVLYHANEYKKLPGGKISSASAQDVTYAVWVPSGYKPSEARYPLLLVAPGSKNGKPMPPEQFLQEEWVEPAVRDATLIAVCSMPSDRSAWTEARSADDKPGGVAVMMFTLRDVLSKYAVDVDRVTLVGREDGVPAVLSLGSKFPQVFASVVGRAGDGGKNVTWQNFRNLPTFFQGGGADSTAFEETVKKAGYDNCTLSPAATVVETWTWIQDHPRIANPAKVTLVPGSPIPSKAYWIEIPPTQATAETKIEAEVDRATNTIKISASGITSVTVYFNDLLVDLGKPVKVVLNGREQEDTIPRSLDDLLSLHVRGTSDPGKLYVASKAYDLPK